MHSHSTSSSLSCHHHRNTEKIHPVLSTSLHLPALLCRSLSLPIPPLPCPDLPQRKTGICKKGGVLQHSGCSGAAGMLWNTFFYRCQSQQGPPAPPLPPLPQQIPHLAIPLCLFLGLPQCKTIPMLSTSLPPHLH